MMMAADRCWLLFPYLYTIEVNVADVFTMVKWWLHKSVISV